MTAGAITTTITTPYPLSTHRSSVCVYIITQLAKIPPFCCSLFFLNDVSDLRRLPKEFRLGHLVRPHPLRTDHFQGLPNRIAGTGVQNLRQGSRMDAGRPVQLHHHPIRRSPRNGTCVLIIERVRKTMPYIR